MLCKESKRERQRGPAAQKKNTRGPVMQKHRFNVRLGSLLWLVERGKSWAGSDGEGERYGGGNSFLCSIQDSCKLTILAMQVSCKICSQMSSVSKAIVVDCF